MEAFLLAVTKRGRDIPKNDKITIPFKYGIFKKSGFFSLPKHKGTEEWRLCILWHGLECL